jgi:putative Mg2+ transporter-C (MgtC) family protein
MPLTLSWGDIAVRLACTLLAGLLVGINRDEKGKAAGMRTNVMVCLAASLSMLLANAMVGMAGKTPSSFVSLDLMRLPLGILSGMGFIGAGAILRKGEMVLGVTTAATLWAVTMLGICFGAGRILLGFAGLAMVLFTLSALKWIETRLPQERKGSLLLITTAGDVVEAQLRQAATEAGMQVYSWCVDASRSSARVILACELRWLSRQHEPTEPPLVASLRQRSDVERVRWQS